MWTLSDTFIVDNYGYYWLAMKKVNHPTEILFRVATDKEVGINGFKSLNDAISRLHSIKNHSKNIECLKK